MAGMRTWIIVLGMLVASAASAAESRDCSAPEKPELPDGENASQEEMVQAGEAVRTYVEASRARLKCLEQKEAELGEEITDEQKALINQIYNKTVDEMQAVADSYNREVRVWRGEDPEGEGEGGAQGGDTQGG